MYLPKKIKITDLFLPIHIALLAAIIFYQNYFLLLTEVNDGIIGVATYDGVDISERIKKIYFTAFTLLGSFLLFTYLYSFLLYKIRISFRQKAILNTISLLTFIVTISSAFVYKEWSNISKIFYGFLLITTLYTFLFAKIQKQIQIQITWDKVCLSFIYTFLLLVFTSDIINLFGSFFSKNTILIFSIIIYSVSIFSFCRMSIQSFNRLLKASVFLMLIPLLFLLSNEIFKESLENK